MKRKLLALTLTFMMLLSTVALAEYSSVREGFPYLQTFENAAWVTESNALEIGESRGLGAHNPEEWKAVNYTADHIWMYLTRVEDPARNYAFELRANENISANRNLQAYIQLGTSFNSGYGDDMITVEMDVMATNNVIEKRIYTRNQAASWTHPLRLHSDGNFHVNAVDTGVAYEPLRWYNVKFVLDNVNDRCAVFVDGALLGSFNFAFESIGWIYTELRGVTGKAADSLFFDNVKVEEASYPGTFELNTNLTTPANGETGVSTAVGNVDLVFNEEVLGVNASSFTLNGSSDLITGVYNFPADPKKVSIGVGQLEPQTTYTLNYNNVSDVHGRFAQGSLTFTTGAPEVLYSSTPNSLPYRQTFDGTAWLALNGGQPMGAGERNSRGYSNPESWYCQNYDSGQNLWMWLTGSGDEQGNVFELRSEASKISKTLQAWVELPDIEVYKSDYIKFSSKVKAESNLLAKHVQIRPRKADNGAGPIISAVTFATDNTIKVAGKDTGLTYTNGEWNDVEIIINKKSGTYVASINGEIAPAYGELGDWASFRNVYYALPATTAGHTDSLLFDDVTIEVLDDIETAELVLMECIPANNAVDVDADTAITLKFNNPLAGAPTPSQFAINGHYSWVRSIDFDVANPTEVVVTPYCLDANALNIVVFENIVDYAGNKVGGTLQFSTGNAKTAFSFGGAEFLSGENKITQIESGTITAKVYAKNNYSETGKVHMLLSLYQDKKLVDISIVEAQIEQGEADEISVSINFSDETIEDYEIRLMIWDPHSLAPLRHVATLSTVMTD